jgi:hypothetical protein
MEPQTLSAVTRCRRSLHPFARVVQVCRAMHIIVVASSADTHMTFTWMHSTLCPNNAGGRHAADSPTKQRVGPDVKTCLNLQRSAALWRYERCRGKL